MQIWIKRGLSVVVLAAAGGGIFAMTQGGAKDKKNEVKYETAQVSRGDVRSFVSSTGVIQPWKIVDVKSNVAGRVDKLAVDLGDRVKLGQFIALIDPTDTKTAELQASSDLTSSRVKDAQARVNVQYQKQQTRAKIASAQKAIYNAQARLAGAEASMKAQPKLTEYAINQAKATVISAQKSVAQAERSKQQLQEQLSTLQGVTIPLNIETVANSVSQAKANMETADADYKRQRGLMAQGYVAKSDVENAYSKFATANSTYRTAQQRQKTLERENTLLVNELNARILEAQSAIEAAESRVEEARSAQQLAEQNSVQIDLRKQEYEAAKAGVEQAKADLDTAKAELQQIPVRQAEVRSTSAQVAKNSASLKQAQTNLGYTRIEAPSNGVVVTKNVEEGTVIPSSRTSIGSTNALIQIGDTTRLWVVCSVDETDIGSIQVGQKAIVKVDAYLSMLVDGKVIRIDPQAKLEQNVTTIPVTVEITLPDDRFKPGMNATCEFTVDEAKDVLTVPNEAVHEKNGSFFVQKLVDGKPSADIEINPGLAGPDSTEIREGLAENDEVITKVTEPTKAEANNPFNPFGGGARPRSGPGGGGGGGQRPPR